jgi:hypothetical protein
VVGNKRFAWLVTVGAGAPTSSAAGRATGSASPAPRVTATLVAGSDAEGTYSFKLVDSATLDYCYAEHGQGYRTTCARLQKEA